MRFRVAEYFSVLAGSRQKINDRNPTPPARFIQQEVEKYQSTFSVLDISIDTVREDLLVCLITAFDMSFFSC